MTEVEALELLEEYVRGGGDLAPWKLGAVPVSIAAQALREKVGKKKVDPPISLEALEERLRAGWRLSWKESEHLADIVNRVRDLGLWDFGLPR